MDPQKASLRQMYIQMVDDDSEPAYLFEDMGIYSTQMNKSLGSNKFL